MSRIELPAIEAERQHTLGFTHVGPIIGGSRKNPKANDHQIDGNHYKEGTIETWDYIEDKGLTYLEGNVVKYVTRHRLKNGKQDLQKAMHYLQKLMEVEYGEE